MARKHRFLHVPMEWMNGHTHKVLNRWPFNTIYVDYLCINPNTCELKYDSLLELLGVGWAAGNFGKSTEDMLNSTPIYSCYWYNAHFYDQYIFKKLHFMIQDMYTWHI
jgi:DNA modification methylase